MPNAGAVNERWVQVVVTCAVGITLILIARLVLRHAVDRYLTRYETRRGAEDAASMRTRLGVLLRVVIAFLFAILAWQVLSIFPSTTKIANALLASSAVLALLVGLAFTVPLGNLGAGILLAFAQPVRIGDRIAVNQVTGTVEQINLMYTVLLTDDDLRVFIPNSQLVSSVVINRTIKDPRRSVTFNVPIALAAPIDRAKAAVLETTRTAEDVLEASVHVGDVTQTVAWLTVTAYASPTVDVAAFAGDLRERAVLALGREQLLPA